METIKLYLENMFMNLPKNEQVRRAKQELLMMMEDKYNELKTEGKTENEAIGIVISEFGNLDEIAGELGIQDDVTHANEQPRGENVSMETVKSYLAVTVSSARRIAIGVFLCICSVIVLIFLSAMAEGASRLGEDVAAGIGIAVLLVMVAIAVPLFIYNSMALKKYEYLQKERIYMDYSVKQYVTQLQEASSSGYALRITVGTVICILSAIPLITTSILFEDDDFIICCAFCLLLFMVAIAVLFFITAGMEAGAYNILLQKGEYAQEVKSNKVLKAFSEAYWLVVTAVYLVWSFVSKSWELSWIIWMVAGILYGAFEIILNAVHKDKNE